MARSLQGRSLLTMRDYSEEEINYLIALAQEVKTESKKRIVHQRFLSRSMAMIFEKRSTRTRCAFETAFGEEGGHPVFLSVNDIHLAEKEPIEDAARVLGRMFNAIMFRGFKQETVEKLAKYSGIPVYNALTDTYHPTQILADFLTLKEEFGMLKGKKIVFAGVGDNNISNSLQIGCSKLGIDLTLICPPSLLPDKEIFAECLQTAKHQNCKLEVSHNLMQGVKDADAIYTDVWVSMGEEGKEKERLALLKPYQITDQVMKNTGKPSTIFLHCLPAIREYEVTTEVFESKASRVFDQAENRKHSIKALMLATML